MNLDELKKDQDQPKEERVYPKTLKGDGEINRPHLGMKMYGVDMRTGRASEVKMEKVSIPVTRTAKNLIDHYAQNVLVQKETHCQVINNKETYYVWAINAKNAERKYRKAIRAARLARMQETA